MVTRHTLYPFISCCLLHGVPVVAGGGFTLYAIRWHVNNLKLINCLLFIVLLSPPWALRRPCHPWFC